MQAIFVIDNNERAGFVPPPYSPRFDRFKIPRIAARPITIQYLIDHKDDFPAPEACSLGSIPASQRADRKAVAALIESAVELDICPRGVYVVDDWVFDARYSSVALLYP